MCTLARKQKVMKHSRHTIICSCGHVGAVNKSQNDQPYRKHWESYALEDLEGKSNFTEEGNSSWEKVFEKLRPVCPKCGASLSPTQLA